jgi:hypothetical protein
MHKFKSTLDPDKIDVLEKILYFNDNQGECSENIIKTIELYGIPRVIEKNNSLLIVFEETDCQNVFVTKDDELIGVLIFYRNKLDNIDLIHIAVDEKYSSKGKYFDNFLFLKMIHELKNIARMIKGIKTVTIKYVDRIEDSNVPFGLVLKVKPY